MTVVLAESQDPQTSLRHGTRAQELEGPVGAAIVDANDLELELGRGQYLEELIEDRPDVLFFVEEGNDDTQIRWGAGLIGHVFRRGSHRKWYSAQYIHMIA